MPLLMKISKKSVTQQVTWYNVNPLTNTNLY